MYIYIYISRANIHNCSRLWLGSASVKVCWEVHKQMSAVGGISKCWEEITRGQSSEGNGRQHYCSSTGTEAHVTHHNLSQFFIQFIAAGLEQSQGLTSHSSLRLFGDRCDHIRTTWATCADTCGWGEGQILASRPPFSQK